MEETNVLNKFKENKKIMEIKMDQVSKMVDEVTNEFIDSIYALVKDVSEEDIKKFIQAKDDMIDCNDKLAVFSAFVDTHDDFSGLQALIFWKKINYTDENENG